MMDKVKDIMKYYCTYYPHKDELSKARLTKLVYLADWFSCLASGNQMTNIKWLFNHYGPFVDDITNIAVSDNDFSITYTNTVYGGDKHIISYSGDKSVDRLTEREKKILNLIIKKTQDMFFNSFIDFVYSTYPVKAKTRYSILDLPKLAQEYLTEKERSSIPMSEQ